MQKYRARFVAAGLHEGLGYMGDTYVLSALGKTWVFDLDGTVIAHNGYKDSGGERLLPGAGEFFGALPEGDMVVFITSRGEELKEKTEEFLRGNGIPFNCVIYGAPYGERILINDRKPSGLRTALAINTDRDVFMPERFRIDPML